MNLENITKKLSNTKTTLTATITELKEEAKHLTKKPLHTLYAALIAASLACAKNPTKPQNHPPKITSHTPTTDTLYTKQGNTTELTAQITDPDQDPVTSTWKKNNTTLQEETKKTPYTTQLKYKTETPETTKITLTATDPYNEKTNHTWTVITTQNHPPKLELTTTKNTLKPGETATITAKAYDPDKDKTTLKLAINDSTIAKTENPDTALIKYQFKANQWKPASYTVKAEATDGQTTTTKQKTITITQNQPPIITQYTPTATDTTVILETNPTITYSITAKDPDGHNISYKWQIKKPNGNTETKTGQQTTLTPNTPGNYEIKATATDEYGASTNKQWTLKAKNNTPPTITQYTPTATDTTVILETNPTITYSITAKDPDGHNISYKWQIKKPNGNTETKTGQQTTLTPNTPGNYEIKATATDEYGASTNKQWTLKAKNNTPPSIDTLLTLTEDQPPTTINLEEITRDDTEQRGQHTYTNAQSNNPQVNVNLQGKTLTITMHEDYNTEEQPETTININISDGITTTTGTIQLEVTAQPDISGTIKDVITQTPQNNITLLLDETPIQIKPNGTYKTQTTPGKHTLKIPENQATWEYERQLQLSKKDTQIPPIQTLSKNYPLYLHWMTDKNSVRDPNNPEHFIYIPGMNWQWPEKITVFTLNMPDHWRNTILNYVLPKMRELFTTPQGQLLQNYTYIGEYHDNRPDSTLHKEYNRNTGDLRIWFRSNESLQGSSGLVGIDADTLGNVYFGDASINRGFAGNDEQTIKMRRAVAMQEIMQALMPSPADASKKIFPEYQTTVFADDPIESLATDWGQGPAGIITYTTPNGETIQIEVERLKAITKKHYYQGPGKKQATIWYDEKTGKGGIKEPPIKN